MCSCSEAEEEKERKHINKDKLTIATKKMQKKHKADVLGGAYKEIQIEDTEIHRYKSKYKNIEYRNTKGAGSYLQLPLRLRKGGGSQLGPSNRHKPDSGRTKHQVGTCEHQVRIVPISRRWDGTLRLWRPL